MWQCRLGIHVVHSLEYSQYGEWLYPRTLAIGLTVSSQYIFANLFIGVVVESFYYVFQMTGGAKSITREEIRAFKKVWAEFANPKTGYLERHNFVRFFGVRLLVLFDFE